MQTYLEKTGIEKRNETIVRNDYNKSEEYSSTHPDAVSNGDPLGKGTMHGGHTYSIPHQTESKGIDYRNFDTENGGGQYDIEGRNGVGGRIFLKNISLYNENRQYGIDVVPDTSENVADGQIRIIV